MTVSKTTSSATFFGNGTATAFSLPFYVASSDALRLYMVDEDGTLTPILSGFSFVGNKTAETTALTFTAAPTSGTEFYAVRETVPSQLVSLNGQVSYNPTVVEGVWDKLTRLIQEAQVGAGKLLRTTTVLPPIKLIGGRVLAVNTAGTEVICGPSVTEISEAAANAEAAAASAELAAEAAAAAALFDPDNFQPKDATLTSIAALGTAPGKIAYTTGVDTWAETEITAAGRALISDANAAAQRSTLGLGSAAVAPLLDEDDFGSNSATGVPSQQSTKEYVNTAMNAIAEGAPDAPRLRIGALQRLNAGSVVRVRSDAEITKSAGIVEGLEIGFIQKGVVRITFEHRSSISGGAIAYVVRARGGVETILASYSSSSSYVARSVDCPVLPGDVITVKNDAEGTSNTAYLRNCRMQTNGEDYFPVEVSAGTPEGNTYA